MSYVSGDISNVRLLIQSERGVLDLSKSFFAASIYESIFTPGTVCDIVVIDTNDQMGTLKFSGDETVIFNYGVTGSDTANFTFALYEIEGVGTLGAQKAKSYTLKCVSEEAMYAKTNYVSKCYNMLCSEMIADIHKNYLKSIKPVTVETTKGPQVIVVPNLSPFEAISMIRRRSVSSISKSSIFVYYETRVKGQQTFNYTTIESLFNNAPVKTFKQSDTVSQTPLTTQIDDNNIIAYSVPRQFSSIDKIEYAGNKRISQYNTTTGKYETTVVTTSDTNYATGGSSATDNSLAIVNKYMKSSNPKQSFIPVDWSQRPVTNIPESSADYSAYMALLMQNAMKIRVVGDTVLTAGSMINCNIPNKQGLTSTTSNDPLLSGNFLISRIHHRIGQTIEKPRYTCIIECIKGKYNEGV